MTTGTSLGQRRDKLGQASSRPNGINELRAGQVWDKGLGQVLGQAGQDVRTLCKSHSMNHLQAGQIWDKLGQRAGQHGGVYIYPRVPSRVPGGLEHISSIAMRAMAQRPDVFEAATRQRIFRAAAGRVGRWHNLASDRHKFSKSKQEML